MAKVHAYNINGKDSILCTVIKYDPVGRMSYIINLNEDGKTIKSTTTFIYFENTDILLSIKTLTIEGKKSSTQTTLYEYDSLLRKLFEHHFDGDTLNLRTKHFIYVNDKLFKIETKLQNSSHFYTSALMYYDSKNRLIKTDHYNPSKQISYSDITEYIGDIQKNYLQNKNGKILVSEEYYEKNKLVKELIPESKKYIEGIDTDLSFVRYSYTKFYAYDSAGYLKEVKYEYDDGESYRYHLFTVNISNDSEYKIALKYYYKP